MENFVIIHLFPCKPLKGSNLYVDFWYVYFEKVPEVILINSLIFCSPFMDTNLICGESFTTFYFTTGGGKKLI